MKRRNWSKTLVRISPAPLLGGHFSSFIFLVLSLLALLFTVARPASVGGLRAGLSDSMAPVVGAITRPLQDAADFARGAAGIAQLQAENARMAEENMRLQEWRQAALRLEAENASLRELLNVKVEPRNHYAAARVLGDSGSSFVKSVLISAGKNDGVTKDQAVVAGVGLVGRVLESGNATSRVLLVTDVNSRVPVIVENARQHAILAGTNEARPALAHIPANASIQNGERVVTSGLGGIFPAGVPVGQVHKDADGVFRVDLFADFDRLVHVRVIGIPADPNLVESGQDTLD